MNKTTPYTLKKLNLALLLSSITLTFISTASAEPYGSVQSINEHVQALESTAPLYLDSSDPSQAGFITEYVDETNTEATTFSTDHVEEASPAFDTQPPTFIDQGVTTNHTATFATPAGITDERDAPAGYFAQIGAFSNISNAMALKSKQNNPTVVISTKTKGKMFYKVQVGPFENASQAFGITGEHGEKLIYIHR